MILADVSFCELVNTGISGYVLTHDLEPSLDFVDCALVDAMSTAKEWFFIVMFETCVWRQSWTVLIDSKRGLNH